MNKSRFTSLLSGMAMVIFLTSCGGSGSGDTASKDSTAADTAAKAATSEPAKSTVVTTPENMVIVTHKVANYAKWKVAYDADDSARLANGVHNYVISRGFMDSNMVMVALKIDDTAKAKAFSKNPNLKKAMQKAGVIGAPAMSFYVATWQDTADIGPVLRSRTTFTVKDWDAWVKAFDDGKQERTDNGITTRVIGHELGDDKKVTLVTAVLDTAKAFAYYKSDALKKRREASGVVGEPVRFLFKVVAKY